MRNFISGAIPAAAIGTLAMAAPALSQDRYSQSHGSYKAQTPEIVERNDKGKATKVRVEGKVYEVCMNSKQDDCINPRAAGLNWGNRPLQYWPGEPASKG